MAQRGLFIVFEGIDGAGKSTQVRRLADRLEASGYPDTLLLHEPGGTRLGEKLRSLLKHEENMDISPFAELLLFSAARAQLVQEAIQPALDRGATVLCDRYVGSTLAYQGYGRGLDLDRITQLNRLATDSVLPHLTVLIDIPVKIGADRRKDHSPFDRFEDDEASFMQRVRDGYLQLAKSPDAPGSPWVVVDGDRTVEAVADSIWKSVKKRLETP